VAERHAVAAQSAAETAPGGADSRSHGEHVTEHAHGGGQLAGLDGTEADDEALLGGARVIVIGQARCGDAALGRASLPAPPSP
jgi:hypothetical protein